MASIALSQFSLEEIDACYFSDHAHCQYRTTGVVYRNWKAIDMDNLFNQLFRVHFMWVVINSMGVYTHK